jgi:hypothetical protein
LRQDAARLATVAPPFESCPVSARPPATLSDAERIVWEAVATGAVANCSRRNLEPIRAEFLQWLLTAKELPVARHVLRIIGADITGSLDLEAQEVQCPINFERCRFEEKVTVNQARLARLAFDGCAIPAVEARQLQTVGDLSFARSRVKWIGLPGARIGGQLNMTGTRLKTDRDNALDADGAQVGQDLLCRRGFEAKGEVRFVGVSVGGYLDLSGARIYPLGLLATKLHVAADVRCNELARITGALRLGGCRVGGLLDLQDFEVNAESEVAIDLEGAHIASLVLPTRRPPAGIIDLKRAQLGHLDDEWGAKPYRARLAGLTYNSFSDRAGDVKTRLKWLRAAASNDDTSAQTDYTPQAYEQLALVYRSEGCEHYARTVIMAKERQRFRHPDYASWYRRFTHICLGEIFGMLGYGFKWYRGFVLLLLLGVGDWGVFSRAAERHQFVSVGATANPPQVDPLLYAVEAVVPLVDLGQKGRWAPTHLAGTVYTVSVLLSWVVLTFILASLTQRYVRK